MASQTKHKHSLNICCDFVFLECPEQDKEAGEQDKRVYLMYTA
jgi:hypothetical protein